MKTTSGKTKPAQPREERVIKIYAVDGRRIIAQTKAKSLKEALRSYYESMLVQKGFEFKIIGNTMQVWKDGKPNSVRNYRALELYQEP